MSDAFPIVALAALVVLALIARERKYALTSAGLMVITGAVAAWFAVVLLSSS